MHKRSLFVAAVSLFGALLFTAPASAQPLVEHVPEDAFLYVGWRGMDETPGYDGSKLAAVVEATGVGAMLTRTLPALVEAQAAGDADVARAIARLRELGPVAWARPWALYMTAPAWPEGDDAAGGAGEATMTFGLVVDAGDELDRVRAALQAMAAEDRSPGLVPHVVEDGGVVALLLSHDPAPALRPASALRLRDADALRPADSVFVAYADLERWIATLDESIAREGPRDGGAAWARVRDELKLGALRRLVVTAGFDGGGWRQQASIASDDAEGGLLGLIAVGPVGDEALRVVPRGATWVSARRFDVAALFDLVGDAIEAGSEDAADRFDDAVLAAGERIGVDLEMDLVRALGDVWVLYSDPGVAGPMGLGAALVHPLRDAAKADAALRRLQDVANAALAEQGQGLRFNTTRQGDLTVHTLATPMFAPSWAVVDGRLFVALGPQAIATAHFYAGQPGNSILKNEAFLAMRDRLGGGDANGLMFADLPRSAPVIYQQYVAGVGMLGAFAPEGGPPPVALPPLAAIQPHLAPAGSATWADDRGWHYRAHSPFPGSTLLSEQAIFGTGGLSVTSFAVGVALPALDAARRTARQMQSNTQARGIHQAAIMYAQGNNGRLPDGLQPLLHGNYFTLDYAVAPMSPVEIPRDFADWPRGRRDAWLQRNASYVLIPGLTADLDPDTIAVFLKPSHNPRGNGISVAYNDNRVVWETDLADVDARLRAQTGKGLDEWVAELEAKEPPQTPGAAAPAMAPEAPPF